MEQDSNIPATAKIITRVFCNFGTAEGRMIRRQKARGTAVGLRDFAVQFTERLPLFDFFDSGRGKERADDKIRGMICPTNKRTSVGSKKGAS